MSEYIIIFLSSKLHIVIVVVAVLYFLFASTQTKIKLTLLGAVTLPASYAIGKIIGTFIETTRPFVELGVDPLVAHAADNGFPSEHTLYALIIAGVIAMSHKKLGFILIALALLVGTGRVLALVHNPIDIIGSAGIALAIFVIISTRPITKILTRMETTCENKLRKLTKRL